MSTLPVYKSALNRDLVVHIVDQDDDICRDLSVLFNLDGFETNFSSSMVQFFYSLNRRQPNVVIANIDVDNGAGLSLLRQFKLLRTGAPVVMLTNNQSVDATVTAMKLGAVDVFAKPLDMHLLLTTVREALRANVHVSSSSDGTRPVEVLGFPALTKREREVLQLITNGNSNKESGRALGISPRTIEVHRSRVMSKLQARNAADLMRIVMTS